jgi:hypothetical protein
MSKSRTNQIRCQGTVTTRDDARPLTNQPGDVVLIERGVPRSLVLRCPCGCGDDLLINLDKRSGAAWRIYRQQGKLTLYPSYWRDTACESHFILWRDKILWCDAWDYDNQEERDEAMQDLILRNTSGVFADYESLADKIDAIPWEVLWTCRKLVRQGKLEEKPGKQRGHFRLQPY